MDSFIKNSNLNIIPQITFSCKSFYEAGYLIGRTFKSLIEDVVLNNSELEERLLPLYYSEDGRKKYDAILELCERKFFKYVEELRGISDGCKIEFHKLFLSHIQDSLSLTNGRRKINDLEPEGKGCTCILSHIDNKNIILAHNEDAPKFLRNNMFIVNAEILGERGEILEKFSTLTYGGFIPGFTMGYNTHGIFYSMNTLVPIQVFPDGSPPFFIMRALLAAKNLDEVKKVFRDPGTGASDGFSVNLIIKAKDGDSKAYNIEVAPPSSTNVKESQIDVLEIPKGESYEHCNSYKRFKLDEIEGVKASVCRQGAIKKHNVERPLSLLSIKSILSDTSDEKTYPIYRSGSSEIDKGITIATGIFNLGDMTWSIYTGKSNASLPVVVLPINIHNHSS